MRPKAVNPELETCRGGVLALAPEPLAPCLARWGSVLAKTPNLGQPLCTPGTKPQTLPASNHWPLHEVHVRSSLQKSP